MRIALNIILMPIVYFLFLGIVNVIINLVGRLVFRTPRGSIVYLYFVLLVFIYLYGFIGAYYSFLIKNYSDSILKEIFLISICVVYLILFWQFTNREHKQQQMKIMDYKEKMDIKGAYLQTLTSTSLTVSYFMFIGLAVFLIWPSISSIIYFGVAEWIFKLLN